MRKHRNRILQIIMTAALTFLFSSCFAVSDESATEIVDEDGIHYAGWVAEHDSYASSDETLCTPCHGDDLDGGSSGVSCSTASYGGQSCHATGPGLHPADWLNKNASGIWHAEAYLDQVPTGSPDCAACHTPPALDDPNGGKCVTCHFTLDGSRTPGEWEHGSTGHTSFAGLPEEDVCVACHEVNNQFGNEPFCHNCHISVSVPHTSGWLDKSAPDFHSLAYSPADFSCSVCHDSAQPDNPPGYICLDCHFSEDGIQRVPVGSGYTHGEATGDHQVFTVEEAQVCVNCHDIDIEYGNMDSCHNCHAVEAPHAAPYLDHNSAVPTSNAFTSQCSSCHSMSSPPATSAPVCTSCHTIGSPYIDVSCTSCHGQPPATGRHGRHTGEADCVDCHQGAGTGSKLNHFYDEEVDVVFSASGFTYTDGRCAGSCHGESHNNSRW